MSISVDFVVPGLPAPQGSKRYLGQRGGKGITVESSKRVAPWRADIRAAAEPACRTFGPFTGPVEVHLIFNMPRPRSHYRTGRFAHLLRDTAPTYAHKRPDIDKLTRAVLDALKGVAWLDDAQVVRLDATKRYAQVPDLCCSVTEIEPELEGGM